MTKLDLGSGRQAMEVPDYLHLDKRAGDHIEYVWDLNNGLPKKIDPDSIIGREIPVFDNDLDEIRAHHVIEHLLPGHLIPLMNEMWQALKPGGLLHISVPNAAHPMASWSDPDHVRPYTTDTWGYFTKTGYDAFPYTDKLWTIDEGYPRVNGSDGDWWEVECIMRPVK